MSRDAIVLLAMTDCEAACRRWCAECLRATACSGTALPPRWRDAALDGSYVAAATARALARRDEHDWASVLMLVSACEQIARRSALTWARASARPLRDCTAAAAWCADACATLVRMLVPRVHRTEEQPVVDVTALHAPPERAA